MESYIVRIYRRDPKRRQELVGVVEQVGTEGQRAFNDRDAFWRILTGSRRRPPQRRARHED